VDITFSGEPRDERMLARAAANHENSHSVNSLRRKSQLHGGRANRGLFR
jgi:hypothetical protein